MAFNVTRCDDSDPAVVSLAGELDIVSAPQLEDVVSAVLAGGAQHIVLDLTELTFCDSTGISVFVKTNNSCATAGGFLRLAQPSGHVARVLAIVGLLDAFPTYSTLAAAIRGDDSQRLGTTGPIGQVGVRGTGTGAGIREPDTEAGTREPDA